MNKISRNACRNVIRKGSLHFSKRVDYGLFLLVELARKSSQETLSLRTIAENNSLSFAFLQKIAIPLRKAGFIHATRGREGGYILVKAPNHIHLKDIIEALEGPIEMMQCVGIEDGQKDFCSRQNFCSLRPALKKINNEVKRFYFSKTLHFFL